MVAHPFNSILVSKFGSALQRLICQVLTCIHYCYISIISGLSLRKVKFSLPNWEISRLIIVTNKWIIYIYIYMRSCLVKASHCDFSLLIDWYFLCILVSSLLYNRVWEWFIVEILVLVLWIRGIFQKILNAIWKHWSYGFPFCSWNL